LGRRPFSTSFLRSSMLFSCYNLGGFGGNSNSGNNIPVDYGNGITDFNTDFNAKTLDYRVDNQVFVICYAPLSIWIE
jgi:hypothetical protein